MKVGRLQLATRTLLNPAASQWRKVPKEEITLGGPALHNQPSRYARTVWAGKTIGTVRLVKVQVAHNGADIAFRLEWADETQNADHGDGTVFPDAAAILFPTKGDAPLNTMGSAKAPVNAWYWRANFPEGEAQNLLATGLGSTQQTSKSVTQARARWTRGRWQVVFTRPLTAGRDGVRLSRKKSTKVAFAVWEGSSQERAGLKSVSREWRDLDIA